MKGKYFSRFDSEILIKTIMYIIISIILIAISIFIGLGDNFFTISTLLAGLVLLFYSCLRPWEKIKYYAIMTIICLVILVCDFIWPFISEEFAMSIGFASFAAIIAGIIGILRFRTYSK